MKIPPILGVLVLSAGLLLGATGCGSTAASARDDAAASEETPSGPAEAAKTITDFFKATTSDEIAAAFPDNADEKTFSAAVRYTDPAAPSADVAAALADFALLKVLDPQAELSIAVDEDEILIKDRTAAVPVDAISVTSGDKAVANSAELAEAVNSLVFRDGAWLIAFPAAQASPSASGSPSTEATPAPSGSGK